jgi:hypothetical protein
MKGTACSAYGDMRNGHKILVGKPEGKKPLGKHRRRREDNTKIGLKAIYCEVWTGFF